MIAAWLACVSLAGVPPAAADLATAERAVLTAVRQLTESWKEADARKAEGVLHPEFPLTTLRDSPEETQTATAIG